ncbi:hypothetical protein [Streptomyces sp. NPDC090798]
MVARGRGVIVERFRHDRLKGPGELLDHMDTEAETGAEAETELGGGKS